MKKNLPTIKTLALAIASLGMITLPAGIAVANPQGGQVVAGNATIVNESANKVGITQTTNRAIIDWQRFSIGATEQVQFYQPSASSVILNRVVGQDPSKILGSLTANGQVFLVNPNGIFFGRNAQIDVAGLVASTHNIKNEDFMAGRYVFNIPGNPKASVINEGTIRIADTGIAAFVAPSVANRGVIAARLGKVALASANGFTLDFHGDELLSFLVSDEVAKTAFDWEGKQLTSFVENSGKIEAQGGYVLLTAKAAENAIHGVINQSGTIEATTVGSEKGEIILHAGKGSLVISGTLDASAPNGGDGGFIETSGGKVTIADAAKISTAAPQGNSGEWLVDPGDYTIAASGGDITGASLASRLASTNVTIQTGLDGFAGNGDIFVNDGVTWGGANKLTLTAYRNVNVNAALNATGSGSVKLVSDNTGSGTGKVNFAGAGHVTVNNGAAVGIYYNTTGGSFIVGDKSDAAGNPYTGKVTLNSGSTLTAYMLINNVNQLQAMNTNLSGNYALGKDIDASATASGAGFLPIGPVFSGQLDGAWHTINNLAINRPGTDNIGMINNNSGTIKNLGLTNANIIGRYYTGTLARANGGSILDSYSTGSVTGGWQVGGLVAFNYGTINRSYSTVNVTALRDAGGLAGANDGNGIISNSYATGSVTGTDGGYTALGSLVGVVATNSSIINSYAKGSVSAPGGGLVAYRCAGWDCPTFVGGVTSSYWDAATVGRPDSYGFNLGTSKTTAQMKQQATYVGWDFVNVWTINEGVGYPTLRVANNTGTVLIKGAIVDPPPVNPPPANPPPASPETPAPQTPDACQVSPQTCGNTTPNLPPASDNNSPGSYSNSTYNFPSTWQNLPEARKQAIIDGSKKFGELSGQSNNSLANNAFELRLSVDQVGDQAANLVNNIPDEIKIGDVSVKSYIESQIKYKLISDAWNNSLNVDIVSVHNNLPQYAQDRLENAANKSFDLSNEALARARQGCEGFWCGLGDAATISALQGWDAIKTAPAIVKLGARVLLAPEMAGYDIYRDLKNKYGTAADAYYTMKIVPKVPTAAADTYKLVNSVYGYLTKSGSDKQEAMSEMLKTTASLGDFVAEANKKEESGLFKTAGVFGELTSALKAAQDINKSVAAIDAIQGLPNNYVNSSQLETLKDAVALDAASKALDLAISVGKIVGVFNGSVGKYVDVISDMKDVMNPFITNRALEVNLNTAKVDADRINGDLMAAAINKSIGMRQYAEELGNLAHGGL